MNKYVLLAGAAVVAFATSAQALEVSPYAALRGSWAFTRNNLVATTLGGSQKIKLNDGTWGAHVALGAKHGAFRLETEYNTGKTAHKKFMAGRGNDVFKVNLRTESILVNAYWDINLCSRFTPYVSAGAGLAKLNFRMKSEDRTMKSNPSNFAWQVGAGVSYAATDSIDVDLGYRYVDTGAAYIMKMYETGPQGGMMQKEKVNTARHEIYAGIRYNF